METPSLNISELRVHDVQAVVELAGAAGTMLDAKEVLHTCSLAAHDAEGEIVAGAVCVQGDDGVLAIYLAAMPGIELPEDTLAQLAHRASSKAFSNGKGSMRLMPPSTETLLWSALTIGTLPSAA